MSCIALLAVLVGCSIASSELPGQLSGRARPEGVLYSLPRGVVTVTLKAREADAMFLMNVSDPEFIADPNHRYLLQHKPLPNYEDILEIKVNSRTFLTSVEATSIDKTKEIILNVVRAVRGGTSVQETDIGPDVPIVLAELTIDPTVKQEVDLAVATLNERIVSFAQSRSRACDLAAPEEGKAAAVCEEYHRLARHSRKGLKLINIWINRPAPLVLNKPADCTTGVCYRISNPYRVSYAFAGGSIVQKIIELPNENPPIEIDLQRAFMVKKIKRIKFDNDGNLKEVYVHKPSELLEISKLPLEITKAVLEAPAEALKLRVALTNEQKNFAEAQTTLIETQEKLAGARSRARQEADTADGAEAAGPRRSGGATWATNAFIPSTAPARQAPPPAGGKGGQTSPFK